MYQPILKGKKGEIEAWKHVRPVTRAMVVPLFEVVPDNGPAADLEKFVNLVSGSFNPGEICGIDVQMLGGGFADPSTNSGPYAWLERRLSVRGVLVRPVVYLGDSLDFVADAKSAAVASRQGIILRISRIDFLKAESLLNKIVEDFCKRQDLVVSDVHLLIDMGAVYGDDVITRTDEGRAAVSWADNFGPWSSVTIALGAFPGEISSLPKQCANHIPRICAQIFNSVAHTTSVAELHFGDYGIRHPELAEIDFPRGPLPSLRYTATTSWIVWREPKAGPAPLGQLQPKPLSTLYTVAAAIVRMPEFAGGMYSWGDELIEHKSRRISGSGNATDWIMWTTNHHIEYLVDRLSNHGVA